MCGNFPQPSPVRLTSAGLGGEADSGGGATFPMPALALALEYEATRRLAEHVLASGLGVPEAMIVVDAAIAMPESVETHFMWRPRLRDPAEEQVLEAAVNGRAEAIVTVNRRDFGTARPPRHARPPKPDALPTGWPTHHG